MPTVSLDTAYKDMLSENPHLSAEMLESAINSLLSGETDEGRLLLRQFVSATIGFKELGERLGKDQKNLMRSLSERGNPTAKNLFEIIHACTKAEGVTAAVHVQRQVNDSLGHHDRA